MPTAPAPELMIIQPWFTAHGHPAQSTINTARVLAEEQAVTFLISERTDRPSFRSMTDTLRTIVPVKTFEVKSDSIRSGTLGAVVYLAKNANRLKSVNYIMFLDGHLVLLACVWPFLFWLVKPKTISILYLQGPERVSRYFVIRTIVALFLRRKEVVLFLRTRELRKSWLEEFPEIVGNHIGVLPSLELSRAALVPSPNPANLKLRFGVIGQIREGKGLEELVPLFRANENVGVLTVAGTFFGERQRSALRDLVNYPNFIDKYLSESELLEIASAQDYILMLYRNWDSRMEAATLFLAARSNRPVVVYDQGWCGRMIAEFGCGVVAPASNSELLSFLLSLPRPETSEYRWLLAGLARFRNKYSGDRMREEFLSQIRKNRA
jgi:glycosyltransferase involved in cell wall biosynthesis